MAKKLAETCIQGCSLPRELSKILLLSLFSLSTFRLIRLASYSTTDTSITQGVRSMAKISWMLFRIMTWITFVEIKIIRDCTSYFHFCTKDSHLYVKMKIKRTIFSNLDLNKCYLGHDSEHSRGFSRQSDTLCNANADDIVTSIITRKVFYKNIFYYSILGSSRDVL